MAEINVVTGALGYTGQYITRRLLALGKQVKTLTGHPHRPPDGRRSPDRVLTPTPMDEGLPTES